MKKIKTRTKLVGAVAALTVAVALSAGTTFAWFTSSSSVTVSSIDASVTAAGGDLAVAVVAKDTTISAGTLEQLTYGTTISSTDTNLSVYLSNFTFTPVAGKIDDTSKTLKYYTESNGSASTTEATKNSQYLEITLAFRTTDAATIYLNTGSKVENTSDSGAATSIVLPSDFSTATSYGSTVSAGSEVKASACNAVRVGFTTADTSSASYVWSPNETKYSGGEATAIGDRTPTASNNYYLNNLARDYYNKINSTSVTEAQTDYGTSYVYEGGKATGNNAIATLSSKSTYAGYTNYYYTYATVSIWIEGTDGDCFNSIASQKISTTLNFIADYTGGGLTSGSTLIEGNSLVSNVDADTTGSYTFKTTADHTYTFTVPDDINANWEIKVTGGQSELTLSSNTKTGTVTSNSGADLTITVSYKEGGAETYNASGVMLTIVNSTT